MSSTMLAIALEVMLSGYSIRVTASEAKTSEVRLELHSAAKGIGDTTMV